MTIQPRYSDTRARENREIRREIRNFNAVNMAPDSDEYHERLIRQDGFLDLTHNGERWTPIKLPLRKIYPAARRGQQHAYFPEGVGEGLDNLIILSQTGNRSSDRVCLGRSLGKPGKIPLHPGENPEDALISSVCEVSFKPASLKDMGLHPIDAMYAIA